MFTLETKRKCDNLLVSTSIAPLYREPSFKSELISQAFIWENLKVIDRKGNWFRIIQWDNYISWINSFYLVPYDYGIELLRPYQYRWCFLKRHKYNLSYGSLIPFIESKDLEKLSYIPLLGYRLSKDQFNDVFIKRMIIDKNDVVDSSNSTSLSSLIQNIEELLYIPYLWGGKSSFGFDCSGFLQTVYRIIGIKLPRDTKDQINLDKFIKVKNKDISLGDVIFFKKNDKVCHVGFFKNSKEFYHCSGYVKINSLDENSTLHSKELLNMQYEIFRYNTDYVD